MANAGVIPLGQRSFGETPSDYAQAEGFVGAFKN